MCGRYYIEDEDSPEELQRIIEVLNRRCDTSVKTSGEIFPSDTVPVLALNRKLDLSPFSMRWGYSLKEGRLVINARSESVQTTPLFKDGMANRRCLIPASAYFEWRKNGSGREKHRIYARGNSMFYMAGVYRLIDGICEFAVLTKAPDDNISFIHDRMPVIFTGERAFDWLDKSADSGYLLNKATSAVEFQRLD